MILKIAIWMFISYIPFFLLLASIKDTPAKDSDDEMVLNEDLIRGNSPMDFNYRKKHE